MRSLNPIDEEAILDLTKNTSNLVIVEDHFHVGGLYSIVSEILTKNQKTMPIIPINMGKRWFKPGLLSEVLEYEGFTGNKIAEKVLTNI
jgi:transketolase